MAELVVHLLMPGRPGLRLTPGRRLAARVVSVDGRGGAVLSIAGAPVEAQIPAHVRAGEELELVVREVSADRLVLSTAGNEEAAAPGDQPSGTDLYA